MAEFLRLPIGTPVRFRFVPGEQAHSRITHYRRQNDRWVMDECPGRDCPRCLDGDLARARFSIVVMHEGEPKILDLPLHGWRKVALYEKRLALKRFYQATFEIIRLPDGPLGAIAYELEVVE